MNTLPSSILEWILSYLVSGSKEDRLHAMLVQKTWLILARKAFYPAKTLCYASETGDLALVRALLSDSRVDPTAMENYAIRKACRNGYLEIVRELLRDSRVDPSKRAMICAITHRHVDVVKELLAWSSAGRKVDPSAMNNYALNNARKNKYGKVVRELLRWMGSHPPGPQDPKRMKTLSSRSSEPKKSAQSK